MKYPVGLTTLIFCCFILGTVTYSENSVEIAKVLLFPSSYSQGLVQLQGSVEALEPIGTPLAKCDKIYDAFRFVLNDGTGKIYVVVNSACSRPGDIIPLSMGSQVIVHAYIQTHGPEQKEVQILAQYIQAIKN